MFELRNIFSDIHEKWMHFSWASWGKVIFSEACTKNSVHMGWVSRQTLPPPGADTPQEQTPPCPDQTPPGAVHAGRYGQQAGGTHPTGVHSCLNFN